jgi:F0F1-type ATP synthase beta subunit
VRSYKRISLVACCLPESPRVWREILDGVHDAVPEDAFYFTGGLDEVFTRAGQR